jgi:hypothetical protein
MGWRKACELRARQALAERTLLKNIERAAYRHACLKARGGSAGAIEKWRRRIVRLEECLRHVRSIDWGSEEEKRI